MIANAGDGCQFSWWTNREPQRRTNEPVRRILDDQCESTVDVRSSYSIWGWEGSLSHLFCISVCNFGPVTVVGGPAASFSRIFSRAGASDNLSNGIIAYPGNTELNIPFCSFPLSKAGRYYRFNVKINQLTHYRVACSASTTGSPRISKVCVSGLTSRITPMFGWSSRDPCYLRVLFIED